MVLLLVASFSLMAFQPQSAYAQDNICEMIGNYAEIAGNEKILGQSTEEESYRSLIDLIERDISSLNLEPLERVMFTGLIRSVYRDVFSGKQSIDYRASSIAQCKKLRSGVAEINKACAAESGLYKLVFSLYIAGRDEEIAKKAIVDRYDFFSAAFSSRSDMIERTNKVIQIIYRGDLSNIVAPKDYPAKCRYDSIMSLKILVL